MTRQNFLKNPRVITISLLILTFVLSAVAIITAITLQRRDNVNPTPGQAGEQCQARSCAVQENNYNTYCSTDELRAQHADKCGEMTEHYNACRAAQACEAKCMDHDGTTGQCKPRNGNLKGEGQSCNSGSQCSSGKCLPAEGCEGSPLTCGGVAPANCKPTNATPAPTTNPTTNPNPTSGGGLPTCNGTQNAGACQCGGNVCYSGNNMTCNGAACIPAKAPSGWPSEAIAKGANCRYKSGSQYGGCNPSEFLDNGGIQEGQMAYCRSESAINVTSKEGNVTWIYGKAEAGPIACQINPNEDLCATRSGYVNGEGTTCNNPYRCKPKDTPTPTPTPSLAPQTGSIRVEAFCAENNQLLEQTFEVYNNGDTATRFYASGKTTGSATGLELGKNYGVKITKSSNNGWSNLVLDDSQEKVAQPGSTIRFRFKGCVGTTITTTPTRPTTQTRQCISLSFADGSKNKTLGLNQVVDLIAAVENPTGDWGKLIPYNKDNNVSGNPVSAKISVTASDLGHSTMETDYPGGDPNSVRFQTTGISKSGNVAYYTFRLNTSQLYKTDFNTGNPLSNIQINAYAGHYPLDNMGNCVVALRISPNTTQSPPPTPVPMCTGLTVRNTRNNIICDKNTNPTNCELRQGDTLSVTVNGSNTTSATRYRVQPSWATTQSDFGTASATTIQIPTTPLANNQIRLQGYTNGDASPVAACAFTAQFTSTPDVSKSIDVSASTNLANGTVRPVVVNSNSTVSYDVTVRNTGASGILHNVIVVDSLSALDANGNAISTPFGDIIGAQNLVRTVGTRSDPSSVSPRNPSGNTYPQASNVKSVEWNKINALYYGETYQAKVTVDVSAGQMTLRNNVCMYQDTYPTSGPNSRFDYTDTNNNGRYDFGVDTPLDRLLDCNYVDVVTSTPEYTLEKTAIAVEDDTDVQNVTPGDRFRYQVTLTNTSSTALDLTGVTITDTFSSDFADRFEFVTLPTGANRTNNVITWTGTADQTFAGNNLPAGQSAIYYITVAVRANFWEGITECYVAIPNSVRASSTNPNFTTPPYQTFITVSDNPSCSPTPIPPDRTPNTGISATDKVKYTGIILVVAALALYVGARRYRAFHYSRINSKNIDPKTIKKSDNDNITDIVEKLKK